MIFCVEKEYDENTDFVLIASDSELRLHQSLKVVSLPCFLEPLTNMEEEMGFVSLVDVNTLVLEKIPSISSI